MKIYLGLVGLSLALGLVQCGGLPEDMMKILDECKKESWFTSTGPPNSDNPKIKCFSACLLKKGESLADGKVVVEKAIDFAAKHIPGGGSDSVKADITECANKANEGKGECEVGGAFHKCIMEKHQH